MTVLKLIAAIMLVSNICTAQAITPMFYGWFFDKSIADSLQVVTGNYLARLYASVEGVNLFLQNVSTTAGIEDPLEYYTKPLDPNTGKYDPFFHITAFYCGTNDCSDYTRRVVKYLDQIFITHLVGVYFTPRTYGIRVNLTNIQKEIFDMGVSFMYNENEDEEPCEFKSDDEIIFCPQDANNFQPTDTRAHVTLGCAPNISAVVTGLDLIDILKWEEDPNQFCSQIQAEHGNVIQMGDKCDTFVYYLKEKMVANSTFQVYYNNGSYVIAGSALSTTIMLVTLLFVWSTLFVVW